MRMIAFFVLFFSVGLITSYAAPLEVEEVTLSATHRIYKNYREIHTVKMGEKFILSDTEFTAEAAEFIPDFAINVEKKEVISRSDEPNNPAFRVIIYKDGEQVDEVWAFPGSGAPHFYRDSLLAFELIDYKVKEVSTPASAGETGPGEEGKMNENDTGEDGGDSEE